MDVGYMALVVVGLIRNCHFEAMKMETFSGTDCTCGKVDPCWDLGLDPLTRTLQPSVQVLSPSSSSQVLRNELDRSLRILRLDLWDRDTLSGANSGFCTTAQFGRGSESSREPAWQVLGRI